MKQRREEWAAGVTKKRRHDLAIVAPRAGGVGLAADALGSTLNVGRYFRPLLLLPPCELPPPPWEPPPLDFAACGALPREPPLLCDWLGEADRAAWLCTWAVLVRVAGREAFCRTAGREDCRAELAERELDGRALFCWTCVDLFCERETAFSRVALRDCAALFEARAVLLVFERARFEPRLKLFEAVAPRLENSPGRAVAAVPGWP